MYDLNGEKRIIATNVFKTKLNSIISLRVHNLMKQNYSIGPGSMNIKVKKIKTSKLQYLMIGNSNETKQ